MQSLITNLLVEVYIIIQYKLQLTLSLFVQLKKDSLCINFKGLLNSFTWDNKTYLIERF